MVSIFLRPVRGRNFRIFRPLDGFSLPAGSAARGIVVAPRDQVTHKCSRKLQDPCRQRPALTFNVDGECWPPKIAAFLLHARGPACDQIVEI